MMKAVVFVALVAACVAFPTADEDLSYSAYLAKFGKNHPKHELPLRESIYLNNVRKIVQHNTHPASTSRWEINHLADWTEEEMNSLMGFSSTLHQHRQRLRLGASSPLTHFPQRVNISSLPQSVDWTTKGVMTPVKNQGGCGSCWAFAGTEVIESNLFMETGKKLILSPQVYVNCVNNSAHCGGTGGCEGATPDLLFEYAMKNGSALESDVPYVGRDEKCSRFTPVVSVGNFVDIPSNDNAALMAAVAERPVAVAVAANHFAFYSGGVMSFEECGADLNHAVVVVGYGTDPNYGDYWKIQNSWGASWGEQGFIRIARSSTDDNNCEWDKNPLDGLGCPGGPDQVKVCGTCGVLYASSYVTGTRAL